jgi:2-hydroxy-3-oxopropionate reductase
MRESRKRRRKYNMKKTIGFIGMGIMGVPMTRNLLKAGYKVIVYNRTRSKAEALAPEGAIVADIPAEVAGKADIIIACLLDAKAVEDVVTGKDGILETISKGKVFIDMTTNFPPISKKIASLLKKKEVEMLDAPVSGGDVGAQKGTLSIMAGGDPSVFEACLPILKVLGKEVTLIGNSVGDGGYAKLANQIMVAINLASMGEALAFGAKAGLDIVKLTKALAGGLANSEVLRVKLPKILSGDFSPGGTAEVQLKDLNYIYESMSEMGFVFPVSKLVRELYKKLVEKGYGKEDHSAIIRIFEHISGSEARK